jgi:hypothetical protein
VVVSAVQRRLEGHTRARAARREGLCTEVAATGSLSVRQTEPRQEAEIPDPRSPGAPFPFLAESETGAPCQWPSPFHLKSESLT